VILLVFVEKGVFILLVMLSYLSIGDYGYSIELLDGDVIFFIDLRGEEAVELVCDKLLCMTLPVLLAFRLLVNRLLRFDCAFRVLELFCN
jgi:hypothetical protein